MKLAALLLACGTIVLPGEWAYATEPPDLTGVVTRVVSGSDFDVNGYRVLCGADTQSAVYVSANVSTNNAGCPSQTPYMGEAAGIYGNLNKKKLTVRATQINLQMPPFPLVIQGSAVIDALLPRKFAQPNSGGVLVQADGFHILIDKDTVVKWDPPVNSLDTIGPGVWIDYKGKLNDSRVLVATSVRFKANYVSEGELALEGRDEFDPTNVPASKKEGPVEAAFVGINPRRFPSYNDPAMQARVNAVGESLIPGFQRVLPDGDPRKIAFRFQLVDTPLIRDAMTMSNGLILLPRQVVERMQNDSQLAAVLADSIAGALERDEYRFSPTSSVGSAAAFALEVSDPFGLGVAEAVRIQRYVENQTGRVSLTLLHDAGYDINQAPLAWWRLAPADIGQLPRTAMPGHAIYLSEVIGQIWHNPAPNAVEAH
ncbi:MAG TPA: hypothetical protein VMT38_04525 [Terracidiphilus sp.]|nr:hypothetical protein [Terracidiphilus sp.]